MKRFIISKEELERELNENTIAKVAEKYKVLPETISYHYKKHGIVLPKRKGSIKDMIGKKFNMLLVESMSEERNCRKYRNKDIQIIKYNCLCDCGNRTIVIGSNLRKGTTKSCGCINKARANNSKYWTGYGDISGEFWNQIVIGAKSRKIEVSITIQDIWNLFLKQDRKCALSGMEIQFASTLRESKNRETTASLDRIDSSKSYTLDNIQWLHKDVNRMKNKYNQEYFIEICQKIINKRDSNG